ncbi:MAG: leucine-rich repeat-containing protein kinase family protein [Helicobacteraceae bacterium]|nr:leucine-rich repeat-containing protein kinase family protein [Helicobacteraceae bacterium]
MQNLADLQRGRLKGVRHLTLSENLTSFPVEVFSLADTLEILDLSHNQLSELPDLSRLKKLKIAFFSFNLFTRVPSAFKQCENLYMLGFKANRIERFDEDILPLGISWLILTDNRLRSLPHSIGKLSRLQKFPVAGNQLMRLPQEMSQCRNLELIRLSANRLTEIPSWLLKLPKLSWLAFSGNPCSVTPDVPLKEVEYESLEMSELLGAGASGEIYKGYDKNAEAEVAVKLFKGAVTSDGFAHDEMNAYMSTGEHPHLISVHARLKGSEPLGLVLELIPSHYKNLGLAPDFETCTRDTFEVGTSFALETIYSIARAMVSASEHLHARGLMHGDLYAHNILINREDNHCYFGDFGAASFYDVSNRDVEKIEVRAFGCLLEDLLNLCPDDGSDAYRYLDKLGQQCRDEDVANRPFFAEISL